MPRRGKRNWGFGSIIRKGSRFYIRWREHGVRRYGKESYSRFEDARLALDQVVAQLKAGLGGPPANPKTLGTLGELGDAHLKVRRKAYEANSREYRNYPTDISRWNKHLRPFFGGYRADQLDWPDIMRFVDEKLEAGLGEQTIRHCVNLLSAIYTDLVERYKETGITRNPIRQIPRKHRKKFKSKYDYGKTPFIHRWSDALRVLAAITDPTIYVMFAVGLFTGMRPGEIRALAWENVFLERPTPIIHVCQQVYRSKLGPVKDSEARDVPILVPLQRILRRWEVRTGGHGFLFKPAVPARGGRSGRPSQYVREHTMWRHLGRALKSCGLAPMTWYEATKHTFASHWLMNGNSIEKLASILGHSDSEVTRRYGHLRTDLFTERELTALPGEEDRATRAEEGENGLRLGYHPLPVESGKVVKLL